MKRASCTKFRGKDAERLIWILPVGTFCPFSEPVQHKEKGMWEFRSGRTAKPKQKPLEGRNHSKLLSQALDISCSDSFLLDLWTVPLLQCTDVPLQYLYASCVLETLAHFYNQIFSKASYAHDFLIVCATPNSCMHFEPLVCISRTVFSFMWQYFPSLGFWVSSVFLFYWKSDLPPCSK